jgi:manganese transport protein
MITPSEALTSLPEVYRSISVPRGHWWRKLLAFVGPGYLVSVGYMDPGNWATDLAGGSRFGYQLLSVVLLSSLMAMVLQALCVRLGVASGLDLAQACHRFYEPRTRLILWLLSEVAIMACDLAEILGSAIALQLLFHVPLIWGILLTGLDSLLILRLQEKGFRWLEALIIGLVALIGGCFAAQLALANPDWGAIAMGLVPQADILKSPEKLYLATGILGATVMPHNLYMHSAIIQTRNWGNAPDQKREAIRFGVLDSVIALSFAFCINAAILILAAATFHQPGLQPVVEIQQAYQLLSPLLGTSIASVLFGVALLASGQSSTLTATLAGQVVMEGFVNIRLKPWQRRLLTRSLAIAPAVLCVAFLGEGSTTQLLILSQVILSLQLPFAVIPLVQFTNNRSLMKEFVSPRWLQILSWAIASLIVLLNGSLLVRTLFPS